MEYSVAIGACSNDGNGENVGHLRVYRFESNEWNIYGPDIAGATGGDQSGKSISLSPERGYETNTGHVCIFVNTNANFIITTQPSSEP